LSSDGKRTVALAHSHALVRDGIAHILGEAGFQMVGHVDTVRGLYQLLAQLRPDLILLDYDAGGSDPDAIRRLTEQAPDGAIVVLVRPGSSETCVPAIQAGARGCLSVNLSAQEFVQAIRVLLNGDVVVSREMVNEFKNSMANGTNSKPKDDLSEREREVLRLVTKGATNREIAEKLIISEHTVKVHVRSILNKLNLRNRQQAAAYAIQAGLGLCHSPEDSQERPI